MKRPKFHSCNHGCKVRKAKGMATNGGCSFPDIEALGDHARHLWGGHPDTSVRRFARRVLDVLDHIHFEEFPE